MTVVPSCSHLPVLMTALIGGVSGRSPFSPPGDVKNLTWELLPLRCVPCHQAMASLILLHASLICSSSHSYVGNFFFLPLYPHLHPRSSLQLHPPFLFQSKECVCVWGGGEAGGKKANRDGCSTNLLSAMTSGSSMYWLALEVSVNNAELDEPMT